MAWTLAGFRARNLDQVLWIIGKGPAQVFDGLLPAELTRIVLSFLCGKPAQITTKGTWSPSRAAADLPKYAGFLQDNLIHEWFHPAHL